MENALEDVKRVQKPAKKKVVKRSILKDIGNVKTSSVLDDVLKGKDDASKKSKAPKVKKPTTKAGPENENAKTAAPKKARVPKKKEVPQIKGQMKMTAFFRI